MISIGLNLMATDGEEKILERAVKSAVENLAVDDIKILIPPNVPELYIMCETLGYRYGCECIEYEWKNDFADARNTLLAATKTDYVLWMDADDELATPWHNVRAFLENNPQFDMAFFSYHLFDHTGKIGSITSRDKIFRREGARWNLAIHENVFYDHPVRRCTVRGPIVHHKPIKNTCESLERNIAICWNKFNDPLTPENEKMHYRYFYVRDSWSLAYNRGDAETLDNVLKNMKEMVDQQVGNPTMLTELATLVGCSYMHDMSTGAPKSGEEERAETYLRIALSYCQDNPMIYYNLAELYLKKDLANEAVQLCKVAMEQSPDRFTANVQSIRPIDYFKAKPAQMLSWIYSHLDKPSLEMSLLYNRMYRECYPNDPKMRQERVEMLTMLQEELLK